jgi:hypothetical protein
MSDQLTLFVCALTATAGAAIVAGVVLALSGYSSAGAFSVAAAAVGVLGTLAAGRAKGG